MEPVISEIMGILQASPADYFIVGMGFVVVIAIVILFRMLIAEKKLNRQRANHFEKKYNLLNMSAVRLWDRVDPDMVQDHYSGEWYLNKKAANKDVV